MIGQVKEGGITLPPSAATPVSGQVTFPLGDQSATVNADASAIGSRLAGTATVAIASDRFTIGLECSRMFDDTTWILGGEIIQSTSEGQAVGTRSAVIVRDGSPQQVILWFEDPSSPAGAGCAAFVNAIPRRRGREWGLRARRGRRDLAPGQPRRLALPLLRPVPVPDGGRSHVAQASATSAIEIRNPSMSRGCAAPCRAGGSVVNQRAHSSFIPAKSSGCAEDEGRAHDLVHRAPCGAEDGVAVAQDLPGLLLDGRTDDRPGRGIEGALATDEDEPARDHGLAVRKRAVRRRPGGVRGVDDRFRHRQILVPRPGPSTRAWDRAMSAAVVGRQT